MPQNCKASTDFYKKGIYKNFKDAVNKYSNQTAVCYNEEKITYGALDRLICRIAYNLRSNSAWEEHTVVAVDLPKSMELVAIILAIYKAGGIFVPLMKKCPSKRLQFILKQTGAKILLTDKEEIYQDKISQVIILKKELLKVSNIVEEIAEELRMDTGEDLAYILFTSGSTGVPKGIMVNQSSVIHIAYACYKRFFEIEETIKEEELHQCINKRYRIGLLADFCFDVSVVQMYMTLFFGHCIVLIPDDIKRTQWELVNYWKMFQVEMCDITPTHLSIVLQYYKKDKINLHIPQRIVSVGEPLHKEMLKEIFSVQGVKKVINAYGPSEVCVYSNVKVYSENEVLDCEEVSVGKALDGYKVTIEDEEGKCLLVNEVGEICITSHFISKGYVGQEELTKKVFIPSGNQIDGFMKYKSNDLGKILESGDVVCIGRKDDQVKIKGHRIELGEIEAVLRIVMQNQNIYVLAHEEHSGLKTIHGFYAGEKVNLQDIEKKIKLYLPEYMIPKTINHLETIEINENGKINKKKLHEYLENRKSYNYGQEKQKDMLHICRELLGMPDISNKDNIFDRGATSLDVFLINARIHSEWGIMLSNKEIYHCENIRELTELVNEKYSKKNEILSGTKEVFLDEISIEATEFQKKILRMERKALRNREKTGQAEKIELPPYNVIYCISHTQTLNGTRLVESLEKMVKRHRILRTHFEFTEDKIMLCCSKIIHLNFRYEQVESLDGIEVQKYMTMFDCKKSPLFQVILFEDKLKQQLLYLNSHHAMFDFLSSSIFLNDLFKIYYEMELEPIKIDFFTYMNEFKAKSISGVKEFWNQYMTNRPASLAVQGNGYNKNMAIRSGESYLHTNYEYGEEECKELKRVCRKNKLSMFTFLSSVFAYIINESNETEEICLGSILHGRSDIISGSSNIIGLFAEPLPLRFKKINFGEVKEGLIDQQKNINQVLRHQGIGMNEIFLLQPFEERIKGAYYRAILNYNKDYFLRLPYELGDVMMQEVGHFPEGLPLYIQVVEHCKTMSITFYYAASVYTNDDRTAIEKRYFDVLNLWLGEFVQP